MEKQNKKWMGDNFSTKMWLFCFFIWCGCSSQQYDWLKNYQKFGIHFSLKYTMSSSSQILKLARLFYILQIFIIQDKFKFLRIQK